MGKRFLKTDLLPVAEPTGAVPAKFWALLLFLPAVLWFFAPGLRPVFQDSLHPDYVLNRTVDGLVDAPTSGTLRLIGAWVADGNGISPAPGEDEAAIEADVPAGVWDRALVEVIGAPDSQWAVRFIRRGVQGETGELLIVSTLATQNLRNESTMEFGARSIPASERSAAPMIVRLEPRDAGRAAEGFALLRRIEVRTTADALHRLPIAPPDVVSLGMLPLLLALMFRIVFGLGMRRCISGALGFALLMGVVLLKNPDKTGFTWSIATGLAGALGVSALLASRGLARRRVLDLNAPREQWLSVGAGLLLVAILLGALSTRWEAFDLARREPLGWDATGYVEIALSGSGLYGTTQSFAPWIREPLLPWLLRIWFNVAPVTETSARLLALLLSLGAIAAVFAVGRKLFGLWPAAVAAAALAASPEWAAQGVRVLRLDLLVLALMGVFAARAWMEEREWWRAGALGAAGAAGMLTRLSFGTLALPVIAWEAWRRKWNPLEIALAVAVAVIPVLPHLAVNRTVDEAGDLFYSSSIHARYYLNQEFAGQEGYPSREDVQADAYAGGPVSTFAYFFRHHSIAGVIAGHIIGYWDRFVWGSPRALLFHGHEWLMLPGLLGAWVLWRDRKLWVLAWFVLAAFPVAFIASRGAVWRLGAEAHIVVLWIWALGVQEAVLFVAERVRLWRKGRAETGQTTENRAS
ncbi:MAG: Dolichyl-phosphate-mannose-protein mannosyltransferase [Candidatus Sumerlaeota bacterium]|nr:Dolichyl-phosphate-mannose-protein mannosyltransferase [Candidatus Sumerlaeota bacterium]